MGLLRTSSLLLALAVSACAPNSTSTDNALNGLAGPFESAGPVPRPQGPHDVVLFEEALVPMRDGTRLATDVYLPGDSQPTEAILIRTPYSKKAFSPETSQTGTVATFVEHGYAVLVQDVRGKYGSEGRFAPTYRDNVDSYDTMDWIIDQTWSNGVVGTHGCSYLGENQVTAAALRHPAWKAAIPMASSGANAGVRDRHRNFALWNGGAIELAATLAWFSDYGGGNGVDGAQENNAEPFGDFKDAADHLPVRDAFGKYSRRDTQYEEFVENPPGSAYWAQFPYLTGDERISVPTLFVESWYDYSSQDVFEQLQYFRDNSGPLKDDHRIVVHAGTHCSEHMLTDDMVIGERNVGDARFAFFDLYLMWFDQWLRGNASGAETLAPVTYFRMGDSRWRTAQSWPPTAAARTQLFLSPATDTEPSALSYEAPVGQHKRSFAYNPLSPTPSLTPTPCCASADEASDLDSAFDQSPNKDRSDVLLFESPVLDADLDVTGPVTLVLFVASDAPDTDFTAKLLDRQPNGRLFNVVDGIQRMRWRDGFEKPAFMEPGDIYRIEIDMQATSNLFRKGHRIGVEISSSNFPKYSRNLNIHDDPHTSTRTRIARNSIYFGGETPSHLLVHVVPADSKDEHGR